MSTRGDSTPRAASGHCAAWSIASPSSRTGQSRPGRRRPAARPRRGSATTPSRPAACATWLQSGTGSRSSRAAVIAVASIRALADWPGRPSLVPVTGGRDSRVVLAAALSADIEFATATGGDDDSPDVTIGRRLAGVGGVDHSLLPHDPYGSVWDDWRRAAEVVDLTSSGTASLADAAGFPLGPRDGPLALWHSGQGGEIARAYYGVGDGGGGELTDRLARAFLGRRPGRVDVLSEDGRAAVRRQIGSWVEERLAA